MAIMTDTVQYILICMSSAGHCQQWDIRALQIPMQYVVVGLSGNALHQRRHTGAV